MLDKRKKMKIGIIDADLLWRKKHRFPNLACMKISSYYKHYGHEVQLILDEKSIDGFELIFLSKVFTDTDVPDVIVNNTKVIYGGTGFFYDKAPPLAFEIEHAFPDYHLYDEWVNQKIQLGIPAKEFQYYTKYSIGFMSRGCIRQCSFCVNQNYKECLIHSHVKEFLDIYRPYICLLDDNVLACKKWSDIFDELNMTGKKFQFKQGLDERLLNEEKCKVLFSSNWIGDYIFAFDNLADASIIESKLRLLRNYTDKVPKFYCFCGYNHSCPGNYDELFWCQDIIDLFKRIRLLMTYHSLPYVMRYADYKQSPYRGLYDTIAAWCNQPSFFKKMSFREYCLYCGSLGRKSQMRYMTDFECKYPQIAKDFFDIKWSK